ncbi:3-methyladenine DNA glycosylase [Arcobacter sp. CECT 8989]|uniref:3-methyladenine DNA glycosylase n=1 Tax=Arcobacter sp. CECT 8989 TaxID=2044509 RepID=UPI002159DB35|nr:3-methyladenine DNA glycosylase [Arcobacter sp. CECT 8989]
MTKEKVDISDSFDLLKYLKEQNLLEGHPEFWWPNSNFFEIFLGAILTQNTKWENVEKSLSNLREKNLLSLEGIKEVDLESFILAITPSGFKNQKSIRIKKIVSNILEEFGSFESFCENVSKEWLLEQKGIGLETADAILCYACKQEFMVVDKYTQKLVASFGYEFESYEDLQAWCEYGINDNLDKIFELYGYEISLNKLYCRFHGKIIEYMKIRNKQSNKGKK